MQRFMSLPLVLRVLVAALALVVLLVLLAGIPALISRTSERVSGFVEGVEGTQPDLREPTTYTAEATADGGESTVPPETEEYLSKVKETNVGAVEAFLKIDEEIRQLDSITPEDVEEMENNRKKVSSNLDEIEGLDPPEEYREQYELFRLAIVDLDEAAGLAYSMIPWLRTPTLSPRPPPIGTTSSSTGRIPACNGPTRSSGPSRRRPPPSRPPKTGTPPPASSVRRSVARGPRG